MPALQLSKTQQVYQLYKKFRWKEQLNWSSAVKPVINTEICISTEDILISSY